MKTSTRNLVIVAGCIVVLGGVAAALLMTGEKDGVSSSAASASTIELVSKTSQDIVSISVKNKKGSYTIVPVEKPAAAASSVASGTASAVAETTYMVKELGGVPINSTAASQVVQNGFSLVATKNLGTVSDLSEFGLKDPQATVEVAFKDGSSYNYKIGNPSATDSTAYYMCGENSENVYIVSIDSGILESKTYFVSKEIMNITSSTGVNDFTKITLSGTNFPKPVTVMKSGTEGIITSPVSAPTDAEKLSAVESALASLTADSVADVNPDAAALKSYGLDKPTAVADFTVNQKSYRLLVGALKDSSYYVKLDNVEAVYLVKAENLDAWVKASAFTLRSKDILKPDITEVKSLSVEAGSTLWNFAVARTKDETKSTEDKTEYTYGVTGTNGKKLDYEKNYTPYFEQVTGVQLLEPADTKPAGTPELKLQYAYFDKDGTDTVEFYKTGDRLYTAVVNGVVYGVVTQDDVQKMITGAKALQES
ncbi:DUF4340 domain-containing protein [Caproiciproducens faecalis]|uniref:DUF4340 domain-containing protein n=1 Tax=Caproiciproducens faecalis TaxID=2820301 RepID=A0ABS7DQ40_9FIRM|nr:DUF4340 domain-containing protein [Caproiciproducens faecalis]MBW7572930.1 DUF4340 domain-containing protein [Caproiciproducens faecalis]